jgi:hypothetical protein
MSSVEALRDAALEHFGALTSSATTPTSVRNRPARLGCGRHHRELKPLREVIERGIADGMPPPQVADLVADTIAANRFWLLTHPDMVDTVIERADTIARGNEPAVPGLITDQTERAGPASTGRRRRAREIRVSGPGSAVAGRAG